METYIILGNYTQQGFSKIKESPARIDAARKAVEAVGGKFLSWHLTMGRYDFVVITEAPDAKTAASVQLNWSTDLAYWICRNPCRAD